MYLKSRVPINKRRFWFDCECPFWLVGRTPGGNLVPRQSTGSADRKKAEALRASLIAEEQDEQVNGETLASCIATYLESREHEVGEKTYGQIKFLMGRLKDYCTERGVYNTSELTVDLLEKFKIRGLPGLKDTSKATSVAKLRCFLRVAYRRGWIKKSLVDRVTTHKATYTQKEPYSDEEVEKILAEALKLSHGRNGYARRPKTFRLLLELMLETGMRIGDAILYDPAKVVKGETRWIYTFAMQKQKKTEKIKYVEAYLPDRLKVAIDQCEWLSRTLPFAFGTSKNPSYLANEVYERMKTVGLRCGVTDCRPHRLRDTAAVRWLLAGLQVDDVARLPDCAAAAIRTAASSNPFTRQVKSRPKGIQIK
jgi:integrase